MNEFWKKVDKGDGAGCWLWTGKCRRNGRYGRFGINRKSLAAHRVSYEMAHGPIPDGMLVCHHCDTPLCVRPDHLFLGTSADNTADMVAKRRHPHHESNGRAKLTVLQVEFIRAMYALGGIRQKDLAGIYGVTQTNVYRVVNGLIWH